MAGSYATFNGQSIFGGAVKMLTSINPLADQKNAFFGANGLESLNGGQRGRVTEVEGIHQGNTLGDLAAIQAAFESFYDGATYVLVTTKGQVYSYVKLERFQPIDRAMPSNNGYWQKYQATFTHLA